MSRVAAGTRRRSGRLPRRSARLALRLKRKLGLFAPVALLPFAGHAGEGWVEVAGRVLEDPALSPPSLRSRLDAARSLLRRLRADGIPGAWLQARLGEARRDAQTNQAGFFRLRIETADRLAPGWPEVELELLESMAGGGGARATARALVPPPDAELAVIVDLDELVVREGPRDLVTGARLVLPGGTRRAPPAAGIASFVRALGRGGSGEEANPVFYLSRAGAELYDLYGDFFDVHHLPAGPLFLRESGARGEDALGRDAEKLARMRLLAEDYPSLRWILVGAGEGRFAEACLELAREGAGRIRAVYLREPLSPKRARAVRQASEELGALGVRAEVLPTTVEAAEHAAERRLISRHALPDVRAEQAHTG